MKLSVIGTGYVGLVTGACLADVGNDVVCMDTDTAKIEALRQGQVPFYEAGLTERVARNLQAGRLRFTTEMEEAVEHGLIIFIAVGTPSAADGSADIRAVLETAQQIAGLMTEYRIVVVKSTVPVLTHRRVTEVMGAATRVPFDYVSNPEFLKEGAAVEDFVKPDRVIIGTTNPAVMELMKQLYGPFMRRSSRLLCMDPASAEMTKYAANVMLATRISFMNELSALCEVLGADIEKVRVGIGSDHRIGDAFLFPGVGFGGSCFPKDVRALIHMGRVHACPMRIAEGVYAANDRQQQRFAQRVVDHFAGREESVRLGVWGLAFKAGTDDVRESPALRCIGRFVEAGLAVRAYDPQAGPGELAGRIDVVQDAYAALEGADALVVLTDWQEFRTPDFERIAGALKRPVIFDGRNLYDPALVAQKGLEYHCVGRPVADPGTADGER